MTYSKLNITTSENEQELYNAFLYVKWQNKTIPHLIGIPKRDFDRTHFKFFKNLFFKIHNNINRM